MSRYDDSFKNPTPEDVYMAVAGGHRIYLLHPEPEDFQPRRTAVSLAALKRFAGALGPYSVAQHAVLVAETVARLGGGRREELAGLHHEDEEPITGDTPSPWKSLIKKLPGYAELIAPFKDAINERYGVDIDHPLVKEADRIVFCAEVRWLVEEENWDVYGEYGSPGYKVEFQPTADRLIFWSEDRACKEYLAYHQELKGCL